MTAVDNNGTMNIWALQRPERPARAFVGSGLSAEKPLMYYLSVITADFVGKLSEPSVSRIRSSLPGSSCDTDRDVM